MPITSPRRRPPLTRIHSPLAHHSFTHPLSPPCITRPRTTLTRSLTAGVRITPTDAHSHRYLCATSSCPDLAPPPVQSMSPRPRNAGVPTPLLRTTRHALPTRRRTTRSRVHTPCATAQHVAVLHASPSAAGIPSCSTAPPRRRLAFDSLSKGGHRSALAPDAQPERRRLQRLSPLAPTGLARPSAGVEGLVVSVCAWSCVGSDRSLDLIKRDEPEIQEIPKVSGFRMTVSPLSPPS